MLAFKLNKSNKTIQEVQVSPALTLAAGSHPPLLLLWLLQTRNLISRFFNAQELNMFALKLIRARQMDVYRLVFSERGNLLSSSPWAHYENCRHTLDYIILAVSVPLLQGIKIPSSSGSHNTPAWINLNFSEKKNVHRNIFPLTWDSTFSLRLTGKAISSSAVQVTPSNHNYQTTLG